MLATIPIDITSVAYEFLAGVAVVLLVHSIIRPSSIKKTLGLWVFIFVGQTIIDFAFTRAEETVLIQLASGFVGRLIGYVVTILYVYRES